jgi:glucokinase
MRHIIGIDLGGTNIIAGCVAEDGSAIHGIRSIATGAEHGADVVVARIIATAKESLEEARRAVPGLKPVGVGIGAPGPLDTRAGIVLLTPNLGWVNMPLRDRVMKGLQLPTALDNDANCAVLGEWWQGAARGSRHAIGMTIARHRRRDHP